MMTQPKAGFVSPGLASLFGVRSVSPTSSATPGPSSDDGGRAGSALNIGAVVGGVVGGVILLAAIIGLFCYIRVRRRKRVANDGSRTFRDKNDPQYAEVRTAQLTHP